jgi:hypothetical protein
MAASLPQSVPDNHGYVENTLAGWSGRSLDSLANCSLRPALINSSAIETSPEYQAMTEEAYSNTK